MEGHLSRRWTLTPPMLRACAKVMRWSFVSCLVMVPATLAARLLLPVRHQPPEPAIGVLVLLIAAPVILGYFGTLAFVGFRSGRQGKWPAFGEVFAWGIPAAARYLERVAREREGQR